MTSGNARWHEQLAFRDALRADPDLVKVYAALKQRLAAQHATAHRGQVRVCPCRPHAPEGARIPEHESRLTCSRRTKRGSSVEALDGSKWQQNQLAAIVSHRPAAVPVTDGSAPR